MSDEGFLARWSRRKADTAGPGADVAAAASPAPKGAEGTGRVEAIGADAGQRPGALAAPSSAPMAGERPVPTDAVAPAAPALPELPPPTLADVAALTSESDFARFVAPGVEPGVSRAALKKLFADPHFNVMDGLDTYIDDYGRPDPIAPSMLRALRQSAELGLFDDDDDHDRDSPAGVSSPPASPAPERTAAPDGGADAAMAQSCAPAVPDDEDPDLRLQRDDAARSPGPGPGDRR